MPKFDLGKQIGPLPLGAWLVAVAAGVGIVVYTRYVSREEPIEVESGNADPGVGDGTVGGWIPTTPGQPIQQQPVITTNEEWGVAAIRWLIAKGYDPGVSDSAIRKYLTATKRSVQEYTLTSLVLIALGPPPYPLPPVEDEPPSSTPPPITPVPPPTAPPPVAQPQNKTFTVTKWPNPGSSLWSIAQIMYGNPILWPRIYNANRGRISNPNLIHPGWVLTIPWP